MTDETHILVFGSLALFQAEYFAPLRRYKFSTVLLLDYLRGVIAEDPPDVVIIEHRLDTPLRAAATWLDETAPHIPVVIITDHRAALPDLLPGNVSAILERPLPAAVLLHAVALAALR